MTFSGLQIPNIPCQYTPDPSQADWRNPNLATCNMLHASFNQGPTRSDYGYFDHGQDKDCEKSEMKIMDQNSMPSTSNCWNKTADWSQITMGLQQESSYNEFLAAQQQFVNNSNKYWG